MTLEPSISASHRPCSVSATSWRVKLHRPIIRTIRGRGEAGRGEDLAGELYALRLRGSVVSRVFRTFILESVAPDLVLRLPPPALRG